MENSFSIIVDDFYGKPTKEQIRKVKKWYNKIIQLPIKVKSPSFLHVRLKFNSKK